MSKYSVPYEGGCSCGSIRYRCLAEPTMSYHCYCRDRQRGSGSGFGSRFALENQLFKLLKGQTKCYGTGPACGPDVYSENVTVEQKFISVAMLDDPSVFEPQVGFWVSSAQPWVKVNREIRNFDTQPTMVELAEHFGAES